jgi:hypothetical protein
MNEPEKPGPIGVTIRAKPESLAAMFSSLCVGPVRLRPEGPPTTQSSRRALTLPGR